MKEQEEEDKSSDNVKVNIPNEGEVISDGFLNIIKKMSDDAHSFKKEQVNYNLCSIFFLYNLLFYLCYSHFFLIFTIFKHYLF